MAQVIEGGEFGILFEGGMELRSLYALVEFALASTQSTGVTVGMLNGWHAALEEALTAPRDEEEVEEEKRVETDPLCNLCGWKRSEHRNDATGKNQVMIERWPRWRCPPEFKTGGEVAGESQFEEEEDKQLLEVLGRKMEILPSEATGSLEPCYNCRREFRHHSYYGTEGKWARWK